MSDSSEHRESEFYYSDELSDNELLEQASNLESKFLSDESIKELRIQRGAKTAKRRKENKVRYECLREFPWGSWRNKRSDKYIPFDELDKLLCNFNINVPRGKDKTQYESDTLSSFSRSIQRHLYDNKLVRSWFMTTSWSVMVHGPRCTRSVRHDLEPNIFPCGPVTQTIST